MHLAGDLAERWVPAVTYAQHQFAAHTLVGDAAVALSLLLSLRTYLLQQSGRHMADVGLQGGGRRVDQGKGDSGFDHNYRSSAAGGNHKTCWDKGGTTLAQEGDEGVVQEVLHNGEEEEQRRGQQGGVPGLRDLG